VKRKGIGRRETEVESPKLKVERKGKEKERKGFNAEITENAEQERYRGEEASGAAGRE